MIHALLVLAVILFVLWLLFPRDRRSCQPDLDSNHRAGRALAVRFRPRALDALGQARWPRRSVFGLSPRQPAATFLPRIGAGTGFRDVASLGVTCLALTVFS